MLLSMLASFLLARGFHGKVYVLLMVIGLALVSFFSVGLPQYESRHMGPWDSAGVVLEHPLPLSFPFYASIYHEEYPSSGFISRGYVYEAYQLHFLTLTLEETSIYFISVAGTEFSMTWGDYMLYYSFFTLVNIVGAIMGYWISKTAFTDKLLKKRTNQ